MDTPTLIEILARRLHLAGRRAVERGANAGPRAFVEWDDLSEEAREGRRLQAGDLLAALPDIVGEIIADPRAIDEAIEQLRALVASVHGALDHLARRQPGDLLPPAELDAAERDLAAAREALSVPSMRGPGVQAARRVVSRFAGLLRLRNRSAGDAPAAPTEHDPAN